METIIRKPKFLFFFLFLAISFSSIGCEASKLYGDGNFKAFFNGETSTCAIPYPPRNDHFLLSIKFHINGAFYSVGAEKKLYNNPQKEWKHKISILESRTEYGFGFIYGEWDEYSTLNIVDYDEEERIRFIAAPHCTYKITSENTSDELEWPSFSDIDLIQKYISTNVSPFDECDPLQELSNCVNNLKELFNLEHLKIEYGVNHKEAYYKISIENFENDMTDSKIFEEIVEDDDIIWSDNNLYNGYPLLDFWVDELEKHRVLITNKAIYHLESWVDSNDEMSHTQFIESLEIIEE